VRVLGIPEYCRVCGLDVEGEHVLIVENGRIVRYEKATAEDVAGLQ